MRTRGFTCIKEPITNSPVNVDLLKEYVQIDFDDHNTLLDVLLIAAREQVEEFLCRSLVKTTITARWEELATGSYSEELPYGPVLSITSGADGHIIEGLMGSFVSIKANSSKPVTIVYVAGPNEAEEIPYPIILAIMKLTADNFEHRTGIDIDPVNKLPNDWKSACRDYSRIPWTA